MEAHVWPILRLRHNRATINLCTSDAMVRQFQEHGIRRVALWPGGVDADLFHPSRRSSEMRERLSQGHPESPLLLCVGRLSAEKDLESIKPILEAMPHARLALVGDGPHHKALKHHFAGFPVFIAGFLHGEELAQAYASSDIFVMPSRTETLGLVVLEAMSSGLPVVAARAGGIPELIQDGISGYLFDDGKQALALVQSLVRSPERRRTIGEAARVHASHASWKAATCQLVQQYQKACELQNIAVNPADTPANPGIQYRAKKMARAATLFTIRKLLP
jgi:glycosyltransferase involved in cell wall biosynthesis